MGVFSSKEWLCCTGSGTAGPAVLQSSIISIVFMLTGCSGVSLLLLVPQVLEGASDCLGGRAWCTCGMWIVVWGWFVTDIHLSSL